MNKRNLLLAAAITIVFSAVGLVLMSTAAHGPPAAAAIGALLLLPVLLVDRLGIITIQLSPILQPNAVVAIPLFFLIQMLYYCLILTALIRVLRFVNVRRQ